MDRRDGVATERQEPPRRAAPSVDGRGGAVVPVRFGAAMASLARCALRVLVLVARRRILQPRDRKGWRVRFADRTESSVYRRTVIRSAKPSQPVVLVVGFRLRHPRSRFGHALFRAESELNTVLFAGFPGLVSKLWLRHDQNGLYRGIYQWDGEAAAVQYVRALWWALAAVSEKESIRYRVVPGAYVDPFLEGTPADVDAGPGSGAWWRANGVFRPYRRHAVDPRIRRGRAAGHACDDEEALEMTAPRRTAVVRG